MERPAGRSGFSHVAAHQGENIEGFLVQAAGRHRVGRLSQLHLQDQGREAFAAAHPGFATAHPGYDFSKTTTEEGFYLLRESLPDGAYLKVGHYQPTPLVKEAPDVLMAREAITAGARGVRRGFRAGVFPGSRAAPGARRRAGFHADVSGEFRQRRDAHHRSAVGAQPRRRDDRLQRHRGEIRRRGGRVRRALRAGSAGTHPAECADAFRAGPGIAPAQAADDLAGQRSPGRAGAGRHGAVPALPGHGSARRKSGANCTATAIPPTPASPRRAPPSPISSTATNRTGGCPARPSIPNRFTSPPAGRPTRSRSPSTTRGRGSRRRRRPARC